MRHELVVVDDLEELARVGADRTTARALAAVAEHGDFTMALSGGHTPWPMVRRLAARTDFPWHVTRLFQVDERVVPPADDERNLAHLVDAVPRDFDAVEVMPVDDDDLEGACSRYASALPAAFDLIHLGLGADGHTASLVPGDPALGVTDRLVALTAGSYQGHRRMTLTFPALARATAVLWLVAGADKRDALRRLLEGDPSIPAGQVEAASSVIVADTAAAGSGRPPG